MKLTYFVLPLFVLFTVGIGVDVYAETFVIKIPSGASDPNAPYFWSEKTTGVTTGEITVYLNDSVRWENADTAFHTVTSVTRAGEIDGLFDSGFFAEGKSYTRQFDEFGDFFYFCSIHLWMNGAVYVVKDSGHVQTIRNVGSGLSDTGVGYNIKYVLDRSLSDNVEIDSTENTLTFMILGETENEETTLILPSELIENPNTVWVDGELKEFSTENTQTGTKLIIPISPHSKEIKVMGSQVIPEFGFISIGVLSISIFSVVLIARYKFSRL